MDACHICGEPFQIDENGIANRVVVTVIQSGGSGHLGDVVLVTGDEAHARTVTYTVRQHRPLPGLDHDCLVPYDDAIYFQRVVGQLVQGKVS